MRPHVRELADKYKNHGPASVMVVTNRGRRAPRQRISGQRSRVATVESGPFVYLLARDHAPALARLATEDTIPAQAGQLLDRAQVRDARRSLVMLPLVHGLLGDRIGERHSEATLRQAGLGASSAHTFS